MIEDRPDIEAILGELRQDLPKVRERQVSRSRNSGGGRAAWSYFLYRLTHPHLGIRKFISRLRGEVQDHTSVGVSMEPVTDEMLRARIDELRAKIKPTDGNKIAFVSPFYGKDASGGAEAECRNTAMRLARAGLDVEILTTCALDLAHGWAANHYDPGVYEEDGLTVRRFSCHKLNQSAFAWINYRLVAGRSVSRAEEKRFTAAHCNSMALIEFLGENAHSYTHIIFIPYLFGTTIYGTQVCPEKSVLIACLHDEGYARLGSVGEMFKNVSSIIFHAKSEMALSEKLYGDLSGRGVVLGEGVDTTMGADPDRFREKYKIDGPFILYAGRKAREKGVAELLDYLAVFSRNNETVPKLVMVGAGGLPAPPSIGEHVVDLGFVPAQDKNDAYAAASIFCLPSRNESFSIVTMEAWLCGTPCLVHGYCDVTRSHVIDSGGGLYYRDAHEFEACVKYLLANSDMRKRMASAGKRYVIENYSWDHIIQRYRKEILV